MLKVARTLADLRELGEVGAAEIDAALTMRRRGGVSACAIAWLAGSSSRPSPATSTGPSMGARGRARDLLALGDEELARAVCPRDSRAVLRAAAVAAPTRRSRGRARAQRLLERLRSRAHVPGGAGGARILAPRALFRRRPAVAAPGLGASRTVTIVGARRAGAYGREVARELARLLAGTGSS